MHGEPFAQVSSGGDTEVDTDARVVSIPRAQRLLGDVTYRQVGLMLKRGELDGCKVGRRRVITLASINAYLDAQLAKAEKTKAVAA
jgi:hypothetical protein